MSRAEDEPLDVVACDLGVFDEREAANHREWLAAVAESIVGREELPAGYRFRLSAGAFVSAASWIALERRCCPFFDFALRWDARDDTATLDVTGPAGAKEILGALGATFA